MSDSIRPMSDQQPVQPEPQFVIQALQEELAAAQNNRYYLLSVIKQMTAEFQSMQVQFEAEKASLLATIRAVEAEHREE